MANFKSYTHLERLGRDEVDGILNGHIIVQPKLDGSNGVIYNRNGQVYCGSRSRELSLEKDNAGFDDYILNSDDPEVMELRNFVIENPNYMVYGEWLGGVDGRKFVGSIKRYIEGGFFVFDVFDIEKGEYVSYSSWSEWLAFYSRKVPVIAEFDNPSADDVVACLDKCNYNLPDDVLGEGVCIKQEPSFRDKWGNIQIAKIVRDEFKQDKSKPKKVYADSEINQEFIDKYVTDAFLDKCRNKVLQACGDDAFNLRNKKHVGMMMQLVWHDAIDENIFDFIKKKKPTINFGNLNGMINVRVRDYLGL